MKTIVTKIRTGIRMTGEFYQDEMKAILKDQGALLILLGAIIIYSLIYAYAYKMEVVREIDTVVVDLDRSSSSRQLVRMIDGTEEANISLSATSMQEAKELFYEDDQVGGIVLIPSGFEKDLLEGVQTDVSVYADGSYFLIYRQLVGAAVKSVGTFSAGVEIKRLMAEGKTYEQAMAARDPLSADLHFWFNSSSGYGSFVMPGLILIILQQTLLIGIGMIGGTGKEKNRHSFQVPVALRRGGIFPLLFGKSLSYLTVYSINSVFAMVLLHHWFDYPNQGSYLDVMALTLLFLLAVIFMGITFSVLFKKRESSILFMVFLSPIVLFLSGISWPAASIPPFLYKLAHVFPSTIMVPAYLRIRNLGVDLSSVHYEYLLLLAQVGFYFVTASVALYFETRHNRKIEARAKTQE
ncbi:ABC transporter permease [Sunxiuqinia elliptica]|uniref:ABC-2 type transport system permease protein n=1 Tax=Sunxiuqinia elliptica TaxID=655355 RepID=A0A1I2CMK9_9BACT|nr:ABC transporter permease [Sunxiuqinia elliptica]SFE69508.1 ABC-2 type transport system permease protein [Sunxiuqinia elliptica]